MERVNGFLTDFWQCEEAEDDKVRVTVALKGGFVKSLYQNKDTKEILEINPAAGGIFLQILRHRIWQKGIECAECKAGKNGIYISMALSEEKQKEQLEDVFKAIFEHPVTETEFEAGKQQSITALRQKFKDEMARSWYYMFEFTEIGKQYTYNKLAKALETSSYEEFYTYKEALVTPRNSIVMINGMLELKEVTGACYILKSVAEQGTEYVDYGYFLQEEGILDCHLMKNMSCSSMGAMYFAFPDSNVTPTEKMFLLMYINEILFREHGIVFADTFDASIVYVKEPIRMYELELADIWTEVNIANARERLLERFKSLIRKPLEFDRYKGELLLAGVDVYKLIHGIQVSNTDMVRHAYKNAEVKVGSGAIINEGGRMDGRRSGIKAK